MSFIKVTNIKENEDGSADVDLHMDNNTKALLIQEGFITLLKVAIEASKPKESLYVKFKRWVWQRISSSSDSRPTELRPELGRNLQEPRTPDFPIKQVYKPRKEGKKDVKAKTVQRTPRKKNGEKNASK